MCISVIFTVFYLFIKLIRCLTNSIINYDVYKLIQIFLIQIFQVIKKKEEDYTNIGQVAIYYFKDLKWRAQEKKKKTFFICGVHVIVVFHCKTH
jgi:hypothetical protein